MFSLRWRYKIVCDGFYDTPAMRSLLANPDSILQLDGNLLKNDVKTTIGIARVNTHRLVVKRYNIVSRLHACKRFFSTSRARRSWNAARLLKSVGIDTPQPVAMIEKRWGIFKSTSYYIHEFVVGMDAAEYFEAEQKSASWAYVASNIGQLVAQLKKHKISHGDLKVNNIMVVNQKPLLIDLDDTQRHFSTIFANRAIKKDVGRFLRYWKDNEKVKGLFVAIFNVENSTG